MIGCFVTGTDTGVGKTLASCALLHALSKHHQQVIGMKPVASGAEPDALGVLSNEDCRALRAASTLQVAAELDNPILLPDPVSPHIAAQRASTSIQLETILSAYHALSQQADAIVVEGAGGWQVPLSEQLRIADLAVALGLPVILVVGLRLGCINHALLSADAIRASGLPLLGWVANRIDPQMLEADANLAYLKQHLGAPLLADIHWQTTLDPQAIAFNLPEAWQ